MSMLQNPNLQQNHVTLKQEGNNAFKSLKTYLETTISNISGVHNKIRTYAIGVSFLSIQQITN
jgi:hypothetical protein